MSKIVTKVQQTSTVGRQIAIKQPLFEKIDAQVKNGFAFNGNRMNLVESEVVLGGTVDGQQVYPGDKVLLRGDAGTAAWARQLFVFQGQEFVFCPETAILGITAVTEEEVETDYQEGEEE